jgi:nucleotide-binding universal stress UspA family protein
MSDTVVVGWVRTPEGKAAVDAAVEEARRRETARLVIVHSARGGVGEKLETVVEDSDALESLEAQLKGEGVDVVVRDFARGNEPVDDILQVADQEKAGLIVIGLRRRSPVGKLLLGSTAQAILLRADCPVLSVKAG